MFGDDLWDNAILLGTKWSYSANGERVRKKDGLTEESRRADLNKKLSRYGRTKDLEMVFIDSYYDESDDHQVDKFKENTDRLWELANRMTPFDCKDVKEARLEIKKLKGGIQKLCPQTFWIVLVPPRLHLVEIYNMEFTQPP